MSCGLARRDRQWQRQLVHRVASVIAVFSFWTTVLASAGQQPQKPSISFQVPRSDLADAEAESRVRALCPGQINSPQCFRD